MDAVRKFGRYGHRDATMILITYRHGLRASEVCDLRRFYRDFRWSNRESRKPLRVAPGRLLLYADARVPTNASPTIGRNRTWTFVG